MTAWLKHLWDAMWPNMFAPSLITLPAIAVSHVLHRKTVTGHVDKLKQQVTDEVGKLRKPGGVSDDNRGSQPG